MTLGPDTPADPATTGYFINHFSLNVRNLTASIDFYYQVLGVRHIFTLQASEHLAIAYMGHAQGGKNGTGYQTAAELARDKNNLAGLIEMIQLDVPNWDLPASTAKANTFGHVGVVVPDVEAVQARLDTMDNVEVLKGLSDPMPFTGPIANSNGFPEEVWEHIDDEERALIEAVIGGVNQNFIIVADPDGNMVEIQAQG